jgi:HPt (histidine-containing phosphotransfer) domain-containing protein
MASDTLATALAFLTGEHQLSPDEAEQALDMARAVLDEGLARLRAALDAGETAAIRELGHALKGNLLNLGLDDPAALARELEKTPPQGDPAVRDRLVRELEQALALFCAG